MATFFSYFKQHKFPPRDTLARLLTRPLSWYGMVLYALITTILIITYILIITINNQYVLTIPARGGTITEGIIGAPHVINPVLANTDTDISLTKLLFSGLMSTKDTGTYTTELADSYTVSPDGLIYTFTLRDNLKWSDGKPLTSADIAFTLSKLSSPTLHPYSYWQDIAVSTPDLRTIIFTLPQVRSDFLLQTTVGILPKHIWNDVPDTMFDTFKANLKPIGSGPYVYQNMKNQNGIPYYISLKRNPYYSRGLTYIDTYKMVFFANQYNLLNALNAGAIDMTFVAYPINTIQVPNTALRMEKIETPITVGLFHLKDEPLLTNKKFVALINRSIDKNMILATVDQGYGGVLSTTPSYTDSISTDLKDIFAELQTLGYIYNNGTLEKNRIPISFSIGAENDPSILRAAQTLAHELGRLGISVTIKAFDRGIFQDILRTRQYQIFFAAIRKGDIPQSYEEVLPLYNKAYPFIYKKNLHLIIPKYIDSPNDRYINSNDWYIRTNNIWKIFLRSSINSR